MSLRMIPRVSILIPTINRGHLLDKSLYLLTKQTVQDFEVIILDDDSQDASMYIAQKYMDHIHLRYFLFQGKSSRPEHLRYSSAGRLLNFGVRSIATSNLILYTDPEVMPLPTFVEQHILSHTPGYVITDPEFIAKGIPGDSSEAPIVIQDDVSYIVKGLSYKLWKEHVKHFGRFEDHDWSDILGTWNNLWARTLTLPTNYFGEVREYSYRHGSQDFWGFCGSQGGLSFDRDKFIQMGGYDEDIDSPGEWGGEDSELYIRQNNHGLRLIENANARAIHVYHPKPGYNTKKFDRIRAIANDPTHLYANQERSDWGGWKQGIYEVDLG